MTSNPNPLHNIKCQHEGASHWTCGGVTTRVVVNPETQQMWLVCVPHAREMQRKDSTLVVCSPDKPYTFKRPT